MARGNALLQRFNAGELSPRLQGFVGLNKYAAGFRTLENWIPLAQGPIVRRPGTRYVAEVKNSAVRTSLIPFEFSTVQAYLLELGDQYLRVYKDKGRIEDPPGTPYEIAAPWTQADLYDADNRLRVKFAQSADVMYLVHPDYAPRKLSRTGHTAWTLTVVDLIDGPYLDENVASYKTIAPSAATGSGITLTAGTSEAISGAADNGAGLIRITTATSHDFVTGDRVYISGVTGTTEANGTWTVTRVDATHFDLQGSAFVNAYAAGGTAVPALFAATDVGRAVRLKEGSTWGWAEITAYTNPGLVTADVPTSPVGNTLTNTNAKAAWRLGLWSDTTGYPRAVGFHEERLFFGGGATRPQRFDASMSNDFERFSPTAPDGTIGDGNALAFSMASDQVNVIQWFASQRDLLIGTTGAEAKVGTDSLAAPLTPTNVTVRWHTRVGGANLRPLTLSAAVLFLQRQGKRVRELAYTIEADGYRAPDMTLLADHVPGAGLVDWAWLQEPFACVFAARADGQLVAMTYQRDEEVVAWHRHPVGGNGVVEAVAAIPGASADQLWLIVRRTVAGTTKRYVEVLEDPFGDDTALADAWFVDCGLEYSGAATSTLTGLAHLEGHTVQILAEGGTHPDRVVAGGAVALDRAVTRAIAGLGFVSTAVPTRPEFGAQAGTAQMRTQRVHQLDLSLYRTAGLAVGRPGATLEQIPFRRTTDPLGDPPPLFTGPKRIVAASDWDSAGDVVLEQRLPLPATIVSLVAAKSVSDG